MQISIDQQTVVTNIKNHDIIVECVAGSGKTSTSLFIAEAYPESKILLLTYNKRLKFETRTRIQERGIKNMEVQSYHSYYVTYYSQDAYTDDLLARAVKNKKETSNKIKYDVIIVDEAQDLTILYIKVVRSIIIDSLKDTGHVAVLGDQKQSIYGYNGADKRFLKYIDKILFHRLSTRSWMRCELSETFRLTQNMADFINFIDPPMHIFTNKKTVGQLRKVMCNQFTNKPFNEITYYLKTLKLPYSDIIVIAPSLKSKTTITLANKLTASGIPIYYPGGESEELDKHVTDNKLLFCTIHQSKGIERRAVILFNFDDSYHKLYNKSAPSYELSNELYVAITRSSEYISLMQHNSNDDLSYVKSYINSAANRFTSIIYDTKPKNKKIEVLQTEKVTPVTNIVKHIPHDILSPIADNIQYTEITKCGELVDIPSIVYQTHTNLNEQISDITGSAIPAYYELISTGMTSLQGSIGKTGVYNEFKHSNELVKSSRPIFVKSEKVEVTASMFLNDEEETETEKEETEKEEKEKKEKDDNIILNNINSTSDKNLRELQKLLYLANKNNAIMSGINAKMVQIESYNWITTKNLDLCMNRLESILHGKTKKDIAYEVQCNGTLYDKTISGYIDCIDHSEKTIYEFKCTKNIERIHMIQVYLYYILNKNSGLFQDYSYKIFNIFTGQLILLDFSKVSEIDLKNLILFKYKIAVDDEKFIQDTLTKL
jgi:hypothetical protein